MHIKIPGTIFYFLKLELNSQNGKNSHLIIWHDWRIYHIFPDIIPIIENIFTVKYIPDIHENSKACFFKIKPFINPDTYGIIGGVARLQEFCIV